jgi:hypothetical protein
MCFWQGLGGREAERNGGEEGIRALFCELEIPTNLLFLHSHPSPPHPTPNCRPPLSRCAA